MDGWKTILSYWGPGLFSGAMSAMLVSGRFFFWCGVGVGPWLWDSECLARSSCIKISPSRELTSPFPKALLSRWFSELPQVGYVIVPWRVVNFMVQCPSLPMSEHPLLRQEKSRKRWHFEGECSPSKWKECDSRSVIMRCLSDALWTS